MRLSIVSEGHFEEGIKAPKNINWAHYIKSACIFNLLYKTSITGPELGSLSIFRILLIIDSKFRQIWRWLYWVSSTCAARCKVEKNGWGECGLRMGGNYVKYYIIFWRSGRLMRPPNQIKYYVKIKVKLRIKRVSTYYCHGAVVNRVYVRYSATNKSSSPTTTSWHDSSRTIKRLKPSLRTFNTKA